MGGRKKAGHKSSATKNVSAKSKKSSGRSVRSVTAELDSGHVSPVESPRADSPHTKEIRDWKDDIIDYYREESKKAWKCYFAASLERYLAILEIKRWNHEIESKAEAIHAVACGQFTAEQLCHIGQVLEKERLEICNNFYNDETTSVDCFLSNIRAIEAGRDVMVLPSIDPDASVESFQGLVDEGNQRFGVFPKHSKEEEEEEEEEGEGLSLSFTGSVDSEDSSAFHTARSAQDDYAEPKTKEQMNREDVRILNLGSGKGQKGKSSANSIGDGKMAPRLDRWIQNGWNKTGKSEEADCTVSTSTQCESGDVKRVPPSLSSKKSMVDSTTQTVIAAETHPKHGKDAATQIAAKCIGQDTGQGSGISGTGIAVLEGDASLMGDMNNASLSGKGSKMKINKENHSKHGSVVSFPALVDRKPKKEPKGDTSTLDDLSQERLKQIEEDEKFAMELAKAWGSEPKQVKRETSPAPQAIPAIRMPHGTQGRDSAAGALNSVHKSPHLLTYGKVGGAAAAIDVAQPAVSPGPIAPVTYGNMKRPDSKSVQGGYLSKTRLCKDFEQRGSCPWDNKCIYAHGKSQLRELPSWFKAPPYQQQKQPPGHPEPCGDHYCTARLQLFLRKTAICKPWQVGRCPYGKECKFAHGKAELKPLPKIEMCKRNQAGKCGQKPSECVYAHSVQELRKAPSSNPKTQKIAMPAHVASTTGGWGGRDQNQNESQPPEYEDFSELDWDNQDDCVICAEAFTSKKKRFKLKCGHDCFHAKCISRWSERDSTCPICRNPVEGVPGTFQPPLGAKAAEYPPLHW